MVPIIRQPRRRAHRLLSTCGVLSVGMLAASCAHRPVKPTPFATSAAFHARSGSIYGILERDLDQDGLNEAVVVKRSDHGFAPALYRQQPVEQGTVWEHVCDGEVAIGAELELLSWIEMSDGPLALIAAQDENPDEQMQGLVLVDLRDRCATRLRERLELPLPAEQVLAPGAVPAGVVVTAGEPGFRLVDRPRLLHLAAADGGVDLLTGVRVRQVHGSSAEVVVAEQTLTFLAPVALTVSWRTAEAESTLLTELVDGDATTGVSLRPEATGTLAVESTGTLALLEIVHGCFGGEAQALELTTAAGEAFVTGTPATAASFVAATGQSQPYDTSGRRELLALREPQRALALTVGPVGRERCVKELRAFGFVAAQ